MMTRASQLPVRRGVPLPLEVMFVNMSSPTIHPDATSARDALHNFLANVESPPCAQVRGLLCRGIEKVARKQDCRAALGQHQWPRVVNREQRGAACCVLPANGVGEDAKGGGHAHQQCQSEVHQSHTTGRRHQAEGVLPFSSPCQYPPEEVMNRKARVNHLIRADQEALPCSSRKR